MSSRRGPTISRSPCAEDPSGEGLRVRAGTRRLLLAVAVLLAAGCHPPDLPPRAADALPEEAFELLEPASVEHVSLGEGADYRRVRAPKGPWDLHLVRVDLRVCELGLRVVPPPGARGQEGRGTVTELVRASVPGAVVAVNGDFFTEEGRPAGPEATSGRLRSGGSRPVLAWRPGEEPWIGPPEWRGDSVGVGPWTLTQTGSDGLTEVIGGFPLLLHDGDRVGDLELADRPGFSGERHPRTAVGYAPEERELWIVVVDGRRERRSEGMTLDELASLFEALGARHALNLDGGGSSVMVLHQRIVSRPSGRGEREVANALAVERDPALCRRSGREAARMR